MIASGDITSRAQAQAVLATTGAAAVMVGRGAQGNPWALREIVDGDGREPTREEVVAELVLFIRETVRELGERRASGFLKKFYGWYLGRGRFPKPFKQELVVLDSTAEVERRLIAAAPGALPLIQQLEADLPTGDEVYSHAPDLGLRRRVSPASASGLPRPGDTQTGFEPVLIRNGEKSCWDTSGDEPEDSDAPIRRGRAIRLAAPSSPSDCPRPSSSARSQARRPSEHRYTSSPAISLVFVALAAAASHAVMQLGPRSWYTAATPVVVLAALIGDRSSGWQPALPPRSPIGAPSGVASQPKVGWPPCRASRQASWGSRSSVATHSEVSSPPRPPRPRCWQPSS